MFFVLSLKAETKDTLFFKKPFFLTNIQFRSDLRTPFEYQFSYLRPQKISFYLKYSAINYKVDLMSAVVYYGDGNNVNSSKLINTIKGNTFKLGVMYPITFTKHTLSYIGIGGVISNIDNNLVAFNKTLTNISNTLWGAEFELGGVLIFAKRCHIGAIVDIGYKQTNIYKLSDFLKGYNDIETYAPAQGYSPLPYYVSFSALMGLKF